MTVKATKIELFRFCAVSESAIDTDRRARWRDLSVLVQQMQNRMWQIWLCHHANQDSAAQLKRHFELYRGWQQADKKTRGDKPKWPLVCIDKHLSNAIYHRIADEFPSVNTRTRGLVQNKWQSSLTSRKSTSGSLPGWVAILFAMESVPSFTRPLPIPFDKENCRLFVDGEHIKLELRIERLCDSAKIAKPSVIEHVSLMLNRKKARSQRAIIERIIAGEYAFKGSSLVFDKMTGKWFASVSYEMPDASARQPLDANKSLDLIPGKRSPWVVRCTSGKKRDAWRFGGNGLHVDNVRRRILRERQERKAHYRWAGANQKGHGRRRGAEVWTKLRDRWLNFVKRYNHELTTRLVRMCVERGIGAVVYHPPVEEHRDRYFLTKAGNYPNSGMSWEFFQVKTMLAYKCQERGIDFIDASERREKKAVKTTAKKEALARRSRGRSGVKS